MDKSQQIIAVEPDITIMVRAHGNLDVKGWERSEVGIVTDINVQKVRHEKKLLRLLFVEDCELTIPDSGSLIVERVSGNVRIQDLHNNLSIMRVQGKLALRNVGDVSVSRVSEDCLLENVNGKIEMMRIGDTLKGKNVSASLKAERVSGKVILHNLGSQVEIRADDSIEVSLAQMNRENVYLRSSDNVRLHLPLNPDAALQVRSGGESIEFNTGDVKKKIKESRCELRVGAGEQKVVIEAGDRVIVTGEVLDENEIIRLFDELDTLWKRIKEESEARQAARENRVNWEISMADGAARIAMETIDGVGQIASQITDETIQQAEVHVREALKRVEEQIRNLGYDLSVEEEPNETVVEKKKADVTVEEKLIVMRLLQQQKISVEEADRLLEVLSEVSNKTAG